MPSNKNAFTRYKVLDELLSNQYHSYTIDDLMDKVNERLEELSIEPVGRRCIEKDLDYLRGIYSPFSADIVAVPVDFFNGETVVRRKCYRYADPSFSIFKKQMSDDEAYLLREALLMMGQFDGLPNLEALEGLRLGLGIKADDRRIVSFTKNPLENSNLFGRLFTAISQRLVVKLHYHKFGAEHDVLTVNVHPYLLKEYNRRWFLIAAAETDGKILTFALDRIDQSEPLPSHKYVEYGGCIEERFEDIVGVTFMEESPVYKIVFWVSELSQEYVVTKPIHESQRGFSQEESDRLRSRYPSLAGGRFFRIDCKENYELIRELTSFGKELIVLSPSYIQHKVFERISALNDEYMKILSE